MHFPFRRRKPSRRLNLRQFALVPVTALILALTGLPSGATGTDVVPPSENQDLPDKACGLDVVLILDRSGPIGDAKAGSTVKDAGKAFLAALNSANSDSWASLVTFAGEATPEVAPKRLSENIEEFDTAINAMTFSGATNWQDALSDAGNQFPAFEPKLRPDLVVMMTDGNPTTHTGDGSNSGATTDPLDINLAIAEANLIRATGAHMFAVGVGGVAPAPPLDTNRLMAISGPHELKAGPPPDIKAADWTRVPFAELRDRLVQVASTLCSGTVIVEKTLDGGPPANEWSFEATSATESSATTDAGGMTGFSYAFQSDDDDATATTITEVAQAGVALESASCVDNAKDSTDKEVGTFNEGGMDLEVSPGQTINCTFNNVSVADELVPGIEIEKSGPAQAHEGDTVAYEFTVTNTGETTLENITVTDDLLGEIGTVASLAPGQSETLQKEYMVPAGQVADVVNLASACAAGPSDSQSGSEPLCAEDRHVTDVLHPAVDIDKTADSGNAANPSLVNVPGSVTFTYTVTNIGDIPLSNLAVIDDRIEGAIGSAGVLGVDESRTFTKVVSIPDIDYPKVNRGTVTAADPLGQTVTDFDDAEISLAEVLGIQVTQPDVLPAVQPAVLPATGTGSGNVVLPAAALVVLGIGLRRMGRRSNKAA